MSFRKIVCLVLLLVLCAILTACDGVQNEAYMFADISECENIVLNKSEDTEVTVYDTPEKDKNLKDFEYDSFYAVKYKSKEMNFEIFAYDFVDIDTAKNYFEECANRECIGNKDFYISSDLINHTIRAFDEDKAYVLYSRLGYRESVNEFLSNVFSVSITIDDLIDSYQR